MDPTQSAFSFPGYVASYLRPPARFVCRALSPSLLTRMVPRGPTPTPPAASVSVESEEGKHRFHLTF
jgi:hypothetical protein